MPVAAFFDREILTVRSITGLQMFLERSGKIKRLKKQQTFIPVRCPEKRTGLFFHFKKMVRKNILQPPSIISSARNTYIAINT
jgi:hypothetical protein